MTTAGCDLCGLPLRFATIVHEADGQRLAFCCQGCRMVYTMLAAATPEGDPARFRESDLYRQCVAAGVVPASEEDQRRFQEAGAQRSADHHPAAAASEEAAAPDTLPLNLMVDGMWCPACAWVIETALDRLPGVQSVGCEFSTDRLRCRYRPDRTAPDQIRQAVARLGYATREVDDGAAEHRSERRELVRLAITGLLSANVMMLSWALYAGFFTDLSADAAFKISLPIVVMATAAVVYGGGAMLRRAWFGLVHRTPGMETLVGLAAACAFAYSLFNWLTGSIHLYFDTACMLITLVLLGKRLEQQARRRVRRDLDNFFALQPEKVRLVDDRRPAGRYVAIGALSPGDRFAVEAEEIVPADGRVTAGRAVVDESSLTGEPRPLALKIGDPVKSGTRLIDGRVIAVAERVGEATILGQMIAIMVGSLEQKDAFRSRTDRLLGWFVPAIAALASATGAGWAVAGLPLEQALVRAVTVMVISCPCALGVAIPMARLAGISLAGRRGILVREIEAFDRAADVDAVVFDKTGTLTHGRWQLNRIDSHGDTPPATVLAWAAGLEHVSDHEIARSIRAYARAQQIPPADLSEVREYPDGVGGCLDGGGDLRIGTRAFAWSGSQIESPPTEAEPTEPTSQVYVGLEGRPAATLHFGDTLRPAVPAMVADLKRDYGEIHLISGDGHAATTALARAVGLTSAQGGLLPADKAAFVDALRTRGRRAAMVGDGVNDAAAMARAHLAAAVHSGNALAAEVAHITLMRGDPAQLIEFFALSRRVNRKVMQNLWCAWIYNLIGIPVAMSGLLTPLVAATAMLLSSLTVIGNTLLLVRRR